MNVAVTLQAKAQASDNFAIACGLLRSTTSIKSRKTRGKNTKIEIGRMNAKSGMYRTDANASKFERALPHAEDLSSITPPPATAPLARVPHPLPLRR